MQMGHGSQMGGVLGEIIASKKIVQGDGESVGKKSGKVLPAGVKSQGTSGGGESISQAFNSGTYNPSSFSSSKLTDSSGRLPIHPLLCLSLHSHCYLNQYGIWGRKDYVQNWFKVIDWKKIESMYEGIVSRSRAV